MLNQVVLVGRINKEPTIRKIEKDENALVVTLAVTRSFKNSEGTYDTDHVDCIFLNAVASATKEYCHKGDIVGVKGRIETINNKINVIAEKVTFLSSTKKKKTN